MSDEKKLRRSRLGSARAGAAAAADSPAVRVAPGAGLSATTMSPEMAATVIDQQRRRKRGIELALLLCATLLVSASMLIAQYTMRHTLAWDVLKFSAAFLTVAITVNMAMRIFAPLADPYIMPLVTFLNGMGLVLIHRLDLTQQPTNSMAEGNKQILWSFIAVSFFVIMLWLIRDHRVLSRYSYTLGLIGLILLAIPGVLPPSLSEVNGSKIWIRTPFFSLQPGEFSKILIIMSIAAFLVSKRELFATTGKQIMGIELPRARDLAPIALMWVISVAILAMEKDLGTSLLIFATVLTMIYIATNRVSWMIIGVVAFSFAAILAFFAFSHVRVRFYTWLDPLKYFDTTGYQPSQAMFGLATGGMAGSGLGNGRPDLVPYASSDFIISAVGEEIGFIGLAGILLCYGIIVQRIFRIALTVRDSFGKLMVGGLGFTIAFQVFVVVGGVTRVIPLTGLTTPFLSYGGSSLLANYVLMALVLRVSDQASRPLTQPSSSQSSSSEGGKSRRPPRAARISLPKITPSTSNDDAAAKASSPAYSSTSDTQQAREEGDQDE